MKSDKIKLDSKGKQVEILYGHAAVNVFKKPCLTLDRKRGKVIEAKALRRLTKI